MLTDSDSSEDDDRPLLPGANGNGSSATASTSGASSAAAPATAAAGAGRKRKADAGDGGASQPRRRRTAGDYPIIGQAQKCGECHHCRNPQMKKACLTARKMIDEARAAQQSAQPPAADSDNPTAPLASSSSAPAAPQAAFASALGELIAADGALASASKAARFVGLMRRATKPEAWGVLLVALTRTYDPACLQALVDADALAVLESWLVHCTGQAELQEVQASVLAVVDCLPFSLRALQSCSIGKSVNAVKRDAAAPEPVRAAATQLITKWKRLFDSTQKPKAPAAAAKPAADAAAHIRPPAVKIDTAAAAEPAAVSSPSMAMLEDDDMLKASPSGAAAAPTAPRGSRLVVPTIKVRRYLSQSCCAYVCAFCAAWQRLALPCISVD